MGYGQFVGVDIGSSSFVVGIVVVAMMTTTTPSTVKIGMMERWNIASTATTRSGGGRTIGGVRHRCSG